MSTEFNREQFDAIYPPGVERFYWNKAKNLIVSDLLAKYRKTGNILEIGCGRGVVVKHLLDKGFKVRGVELAGLEVDDSLRSYIKTGTDAFDLDVNEYKNVNIILLCDVIEHLEKPSLFLEKLVQHFPGVERFVLTVPARQEIFSNYDEFNGHYRRYDKKMLVSEFSNIKHRVTKLTYAFHSLYPPAKLLLNTKGKRNVVVKAPQGFISNTLHSLIAHYFLLDYKLFPSGLYGTSVMTDIQIFRK